MQKYLLHQNRIIFHTSVYYHVLKFRIECRYVGCRGYVSSMQLSFLSFTFIEKVLRQAGRIRGGER